MNRFGRRWTLGGLLVAVTLVPGAARANSKFINVQGKLTDGSGNPLTSTQTVTFRLYTSSTASVGSAIWTESQTITLSTGLFNVALGTATALDPLPFTQAYYLGIQVAGDPNELSPRQALGASAYAQGSLGNFGVAGSTLSVVTGSLGVGTTAPTAKLHVSSGTVLVDGNGTTAFRAQVLSGYNAYAVNNMSVTGQGNIPGWLFYPFTNGTNTDVRWQEIPGNSGAVDRLAFQAGGNLGIGTTNPAAKLHLSSGTVLVDGNATSGLKTELASGSNAVTIFNMSVTGQAQFPGWSLYPNTNGNNTDMRWQEIPGNSGAADRIAFQAGGNVGIGTTSPATKLHISSGALTIDGSGAALNVSGQIQSTSSGFKFPDGTAQTTAVPSANTVGNYVAFNATNTAALGIWTTVGVASVTFVSSGRYYINLSSNRSGTSFVCGCTAGGKTANDVRVPLSCIIRLKFPRFSGS